MSSTHRPGPRLVQKRLMPMPPQPVPGPTDDGDAFVDSPTECMDLSEGTSSAIACATGTAKSLDCQAIATALDFPKRAPSSAETLETPSGRYGDAEQDGEEGCPKGVAVDEHTREERGTATQGGGTAGNRDEGSGATKPARKNSTVRRRQRKDDADGERGGEDATGGSGRSRVGKEAREEEEEEEEVQKRNGEKKAGRRRASAPCGMLHSNLTACSLLNDSRPVGSPLPPWKFHGCRNTLRRNPDLH